MGIDDPMNDRESEPGAGLPRREEWVEDSIAKFHRNSETIVLDDETKMFDSSTFSRGAQHRLIDRQSDAGVDDILRDQSLARIAHHVGQGLGDRSGIDHRKHLGIDPEVDGDRITLEERTVRGECLIHQILGETGPHGHLGVACEIQNIANDGVEGSNRL